MFALFQVPARQFFLGYRKVDLSEEEILASVFLPWTRQHEYVKEFKQAHRRDDDIALVNAGMRVAFEQKGGQWVRGEFTFKT
jgi:xanthine dehydrogenase/oxidase